MTLNCFDIFLTSSSIKVLNSFDVQSFLQQLVYMGCERSWVRIPPSRPIISNKFKDLVNAAPVIGRHATHGINTLKTRGFTTFLTLFWHRQKANVIYYATTKFLQFFTGKANSAAGGCALNQHDSQRNGGFGEWRG